MILLFSFIFGLLFGSFANVCIVRLPKDESLWRPRSKCPGCGTPISWWDNIPLLSFAILRGRCRACRNPIAWRYPVVELLMGLVFLIAALTYPGSWRAMVVTQCLGFYILTISIIDAQHRIIPDELSLSLLILGLVISPFNPFLNAAGWLSVRQSLLAALTGGGLMLATAWLGEKIFHKEAMGGGDVKLMAAFGAILGWEGLMGPLLIGSLAGGLYGLLLLGLKKRRWGEAIPFGPFLCFGAWMVCLFPTKLLNLIFP